MINSLKNIGGQIGSNLIKRVDHVVCRSTYAFQKERDFIFKLDKAPATGSVPKQIERMVSHGGYGRFSEEDLNLYLFTHNPPVGIPNIKIDTVDIDGQKKDQFLVGPFRLAPEDTGFAGVADSSIAPKQFSVASLSADDVARLNKIKAYILLDSRDEIKEFFTSPIKEVISLKRQLGRINLNYEQYDISS